MRAAESSRSIEELFATVVDSLRRAIPVDGWCGHTLDPATGLPTGGDSRAGYRPELVPRLLEIEYAVGDVNPFDELLRRRAPVGVLSEATGGVPARSPRYREIMVPSGFEHELRLVFRHQDRPWGALVLLRGDDAPGFRASDSALASSLSGALAVAVKRLLLQAYVESGGLPDSPGLLLLDADLGVESITPEAQRRLEQLREGPGELPLSVVALAASAAEGEGRAARSRVRLPSGSWVTMTAWAMGDRTAISLESSAPHDLTALALEAYSLSGRERQVVELVLLGLPTSEIARRLFLSPYTVQDHLKTVFEKTGVRSRRELAADLFFRHYLPRIERGTALTSDGWFAEG